MIANSGFKFDKFETLTMKTGFLILSRNTRTSGRNKLYQVSYLVNTNLRGKNAWIFFWLPLSLVLAGEFVTNNSNAIFPLIIFVAP